MAIVSLIIISSSLQNAIQGEFAKIGSNRIYVMAKSNSLFSLTQGLTENDVEALRNLNELKWVNPYLLERTSVESNNDKKVLSVFATEIEDLGEKWADLDLKLDRGRFFSSQDKYSVIIGSSVAKTAFERELIINNDLMIKDHKFRVVGILTEVGNPEDDNQIYIPLDTAREVFEKQDAVSIIELVVKEGFDVKETAAKIQKTLVRERGEKLSAIKKNKLNFDVITPDHLMGQFNNVLLIVQVILISIATVSLIVGAIGIMNSMYTSVLERTKDIGVMKAIGAKRHEILKLFMVEAAIIGFVGGFIGIILGIIVAKGFEQIAIQSGFSFFKITLDPLFLIGMLIFSVFFGILSGALPASKAAKMNVVEALRS
jgi:putative ABC transport system permease protein